MNRFVALDLDPLPLKRRRIFLQNAWSPAYAGVVWPRESWLRALARSRSGLKLRILTNDLRIVHNIAPICGATPSSITEPDRAHVETILRAKPDVVVACGLHAEHALRLWWHGPLLCIPHPASRVVTNHLYQSARKLLDLGFHGRLAIRQLPGAIRVESLNGSRPHDDARMEALRKRIERAKRKAPKVAPIVEEDT